MACNPRKVLDDPDQHKIDSPSSRQRLGQRIAAGIDTGWNDVDALLAGPVGSLLGEKTVAGR